MAFTYQSVVDLARIPLNDDDKARYSDSKLLSFANQGVLAFAKRRPDEFIGQFNSLPTGEALLADLLPVDVGYVQTIADYITARAEMTDDEHADSGRAVLFSNLFSADAPI
ncbi:MAG: hypothetical protein ABI216_22105 [Devosia sp.]